MKTKIGFQGDFFSNSHNAAITFAADHEIEIDGVPLINSHPVLEELIKGRIDYGVVAYRNSTAGLVNETQQALAEFRQYVKEIEEITLPIHHCLFTLPEEYQNSIRYIVSHEQALKQCDEYLKQYFPAAEIQKEKDTSLAAVNLVGGKYDPGTAVVCSKECGTHYSLKLISESIETNKNNRTTFKVFVRHFRQI